MKANLEFNSALNFKITSVTECASFESTFLRIVGISLGDCVKECGARLKCSALNYHRLRQACLLMSEDDGSTSASTTTDITTGSSTYYDININNNNVNSDSTISTTDITTGSSTYHGSDYNNNNVNSDSTISTTTTNSSSRYGSHENSSSGSTNSNSSTATTTYISTSDVFGGSTTSYSRTAASTDCISKGGSNYCSNSNIIYETCFLVNKEDIQINGNCSCATNNVCREKNGVYQCHFEECDRLLIAEAVIYGNMNTVGSIARYECNEPYKPTSDIAVKCLPSGLWGPTPGCIVDCGEPDVGRHVILDQGGTVVDDIRTIMCKEGYALAFNQKLDIFTVKCQENGSWSMEKIECVKENRIGNFCNLDLDCANTESKCIYNKCFCDALYRWNNSTNDCVKVCDTMADEFTIHKDIYIKDYNYNLIGDTTIEDCKALCRAVPTCYHFEGRDHLNCRLGSVTIEMIRDADPGAMKERLTSGIWDVYSRKCV